MFMVLAILASAGVDNLTVSRFEISGARFLMEN